MVDPRRMEEEVFDRQTALVLLWDANGPARVVEILREHAAARDPSIIDEIDEEIKGCRERGQAGAVEQLERVAKTLGQIRQCIEMLAEVHDLGDLVRCYEGAPCCWWRGFFNLAEVLAQDWRAKGETSRAEGIERGLHVKAQLDDLLARLEALLNNTANAHEHLRSTPELCSPDFHAFLLANADVVAGVERQYALVLRQVVHNLKESCRVLAAFDKKSNSRPLTYREASVWYLLYGPLTKACSDVAGEVVRGTRDAFDAGELLVTRFGGRDEPFRRVAVLSTFYEHALRSSPPEAIAALTWAARLVLEIQADYPDPRLFPTHVLHYAMGLVERWQMLPDPQPALRDCEQLIASVLPAVTPDRSPRLYSDLHLYRAKVLENLGRWSVQDLEDAVVEYRAGLAVPGVMHEHVTRGTEIGNLANTLWALWKSQGNVDEHEVEQLYEKALSHLDSDRERFLHALVLANYAVFWNERPSGEEAKNQEEALSRIDAAIKLIETASEDDMRTPARLRYLRCSFERTRGNILTSRLYGEPSDNLRAAIDAYDRALSMASVNDEESSFLRGMVQLNRGHAHLSLYEHDKEEFPASLQSAFRAFDESTTFLQGDPTALAEAFMGRALTLARMDDPDDDAYALDDARRAVALFESTGGTAAAALGLYNLAILLWENARTLDELARVRDLLEQALQAYELRSDSVMVTRSALNAARISWRLFADGGTDGESARAQFLLERASEAAENLWAGAKSSDHRFEISELVTAVYSDLLWIRTQRGASNVEAWRLSARAKHPDLLLQLDILAKERTLGGPDYIASIQNLRMSIHRTEAEKWRLVRDDLNPGESLAAKLEVLDRQTARIQSARRLVERTSMQADREVAGHVERIIEQDKDLIILDITVGYLGTTVIVAGEPVIVAGEAVGTAVRHLPLTRAELGKELQKWTSSYATYRMTRGAQRGVKYEEWAQATDELLKYVGTHLIAPALGVVDRSRLQTTTIAFNPGSLFKVPLHAAQVNPPDDARLCDLVDSFMYVPSVLVIPSAKDWAPPRRALCVLADTPLPGEAMLREAPGELREVAATLCGAGINVRVLAARGAASGRQVFDEVGISLAPGTDLSPERPTPERVLSALPEHDHVFYTGHGTSSEVPSLILCNEDGTRLELTAIDVFSSGLVSSKDFYLSACETAHDRLPSNAEPGSLAAFLLRMGARSVIATAWVAEERLASSLSKQFYQELVGSGWNIVKAFARALRRVRAARPEKAVRWAAFMPFFGARPVAD